MAKLREMNVRFPLGGENRSAGYAQKDRPYTTPRAINIRGFESLERRGRGGTRPMLAKHISAIINSSAVGDITTSVYSEKSLDVSSQDNSPRDVYVSSDGTKMYVLGDQNNTVYQYTLTTAGDTGTATYASKSFSISSQDSTPTGIFFNSDESIMYIVGNQNATIYQYTLSTAGDVSTASYASKSLDVSSQESTPNGLSFSSDGSKAYIVGLSNKTVYQYTISTPWDVSTGSYASKSVLISAEESIPTGVTFNSSGTIMYIIGFSDDINQYTVGTGWDVSTAAYASKLFDVGSQESSATGLYVKSDGLRFYVVGTSSDTVYQYSMGPVITGMEKVSYLDGSGNLQHDLVVICDGNLFVVQGSSATQTTSYWSIGTDTIVIGSDSIIFDSTVDSVNPIGNTDAYDMVEHGGKVYIASTALTKYDPVSGAITTVANAPASQPNVTIYQNRLVLYGKDHIYYMSRMNNFTDWNFADDYKFENRAVSGFLGDKGIIGGKINCMLPWRDKALVAGTNDDLWVFYENPRSTSDPFNNVSRHVGIISHKAACVTPNGLVIFLGRDGLYTWQIGSNADPEPFSPRVIPDKLRDVSVTTNDIIMEYDHKNRGVHLFITPSSLAGEHWWLDLENKGIWSEKFDNDDHQPLVASRLPQSGDSDIVMGCKDGYLRKLSNSATNDDGTVVTSHLLLGPFHTSGEYGRDGMLQRIIGDLAESSGTVTWRTVVAKTAEEAVDNAVSDLEAGTTVNVDKSGDWAANRNNPSYTRSRGPWLVLWLTSTARWSYESVSTFLIKLGRLR